MKQSEIISLVGLASTDPKLLAFFAHHGLKSPKSVNANQSGKVVRYKEYNIDFVFDFDIVHDDYYPPVSAKQNDYDFIAYLRDAYFYPPGKHNKIPADFWDVTPDPAASYDEFAHYFQLAEPGNFTKKLNPLIEIEADYSLKKQKCEHIACSIAQEREIVSYHFFDPDNEHNLWPEAYTFLIKWLFDNRFLEVADSVYQLGLPASHHAILEFVTRHLKNRLWNNQLKAVPELFGFLQAIRSNNGVWKDENKKKVVLYQNHLFLMANGKYDAYQKLFYEDIFEADELCKATRFTPETAQLYINLLTERFALYKRIKDLKVNR